MEIGADFCKADKGHGLRGGNFCKADKGLDLGGVKPYLKPAGATAQEPPVL